MLRRNAKKSCFRPVMDLGTQLTRKRHCCERSQVASLNPEPWCAVSKQTHVPLAQLLNSDHIWENTEHWLTFGFFLCRSETECADDLRITQTEGMTCCIVLPLPAIAWSVDWGLEVITTVALRFGSRDLVEIIKQTTHWPTEEPGTKNCSVCVVCLVGKKLAGRVLIETRSGDYKNKVMCHFRECVQTLEKWWQLRDLEVPKWWAICFQEMICATRWVSLILKTFLAPMDLAFRLAPQQI